MAEPTMWGAFKASLVFISLALLVGLIATQILKWFGIVPPI